MSVHDLSGSTAVVTGASRGFGRGIANALARVGAEVVGVARDRASLEEVRLEIGDAFTPVVADAADPTVAGQVIDEFRPRTLVLNAGADPLARPIQHHTWQTFSRNWEVDVQHAFHWTRDALLAPLEPESMVIAISSGAALRGSPLSGGYAGAKATIRFISAYADDESDRNELGIRFISVLPQLTPATDLGSKGVAAYAKRQGVDAAAFERQLGSVLTPDRVGTAVVDLTLNLPVNGGAYILSADGLNPAPT